MRLLTAVAIRWLIAAALALAALGAGWIGLMAGNGSVPALIPRLVLMGCGAGIINPVLTGRQLAAFAPRDGGIAAGINGGIRYVGVALGTAVLGAVAQNRIAAQLGEVMAVAAPVLIATVPIAAWWLPAFGVEAGR